MKAIQSLAVAVVAVAIIISSGPAFADDEAESYVGAKLKHIVIPEVEFDDTPISQAIEFLRTKSVELDQLEPDPARKGINIILLNEPQVLLLGAEEEGLISLKARNMTLSSLLHYVAQISGFKVDTHAEAVVIGTEDELREMRWDLGLEERPTAPQPQRKIVLPRPVPH